MEIAPVFPKSLNYLIFLNNPLFSGLADYRIEDGKVAEKMLLNFNYLH